jgi:hypothetical protein
MMPLRQETQSIHRLAVIVIYIVAAMIWSGAFGARSGTASQIYLSDQERAKLKSGGSLIRGILPDPRGGRAYRLIYLVDVPLPVYWRFKTDFDNTFLTSHKYILRHQFLHREGNVIITANEYRHFPNKRFTWQTTVFLKKHRLEFALLKPEEAGHQFHYGHIQLKSLGDKTLVTQVAYFDFSGATLWYYLPWVGGMKSFLKYTAKWEQHAIIRMKARYEQMN